MVGTLDFDRELEALSCRAQDAGDNAILLVKLLGEFPQRAGEIVQLLDFPLDRWAWTDLKNFWCALIEGYKSIGHGLDRQTWADNCRTWIGRQTQIKIDTPRSLVRLALGYGSAFHTLRSLEFVFDLARQWGGEGQARELGAMLAEPAMAHALDGRDEAGKELLRELCGYMDMEAWIGSHVRQSWIHLWGSMAMDGQTPDHIEQSLGILLSQGARMDQLDEKGRNILDWILSRDIQPHTNDIDILAGIIGALLTHGWSLEDQRMEKSVHRVRPLLESHPVIRRKKLQEMAVKNGSQSDEGENGTTLM